MNKHSFTLIYNNSLKHTFNYKNILQNNNDLRDVYLSRKIFTIKPPEEIQIEINWEDNLENNNELVKDYIQKHSKRETYSGKAHIPLILYYIEPYEAFMKFTTDPDNVYFRINIVNGLYLHKNLFHVYIPKRIISILVIDEQFLSDKEFSQQLSFF